MTNRSLSNDPYLTPMGAASTTAIICPYFRVSGTNLVAQYFQSATLHGIAVSVTTSLGRSVFQATRPAIWRTSAVWGTKSAEGFTVLWVTSAARSTDREISYWEEALSVQSPYEFRT